MFILTSIKNTLPNGFHALVLFCSSPRRDMLLIVLGHFTVAFCSSTSRKTWSHKSFFRGPRRYCLCPLSILSPMILSLPKNPTIVAEFSYQTLVFSFGAFRLFHVVFFYLRKKGNQQQKVGAGCVGFCCPQTWSPPRCVVSRFVLNQHRLKYRFACGCVSKPAGRKTQKETIPEVINPHQ